MPSSSPERKIHGADSSTRGLRPSLQTLCGRFFCGSVNPHNHNEPCPGNLACTHSVMDLGSGSDQVVEATTVEGKRKVNCPDCLEVIAAKSAELARAWAKGDKKPWY